MADVPFGTPGFAGLGGQSSSPFGFDVNLGDVPDDFGGVVDAAGDVLRDEGADLGRSFLDEIGVDPSIPQQNPGLNFTDPTTGAGNEPPVMPETQGVGMPTMLLVGGALLFAVLVSTGSIDL